jgi:hypothetical protein
MKTINRTLGRSLLMLISLLALNGTFAHADSHAPALPTGVLEVFQCNYNSGKDRDDVNALRDYYVKQAEKVGYSTPDAFLWTMTNGSWPNQLAWINVHEDLNAYAKSYDAVAASSELAAVNERAETVMTCMPALGTYAHAFIRDPDAEGPWEATVASYACNLRPEQDMSDLASLMEHVATVNEAMGDDAMDELLHFIPTTGMHDQPDVFVFGASRSGASSWASHLALLEGSAAGRAVLAHFDSVLDCRLSLWDVEQMVGG